MTNMAALSHILARHILPPKLVGLLSVFACSGLLSGCDEPRSAPAPTEDRSAPTADRSAPTPPATPKTSPSPTSAAHSIENQVEARVREWNDAHSSRRKEAFEEFFAERVHFYGATLKREEVVSKKMQVLAEKTDFEQKLTSKIRVVEKDGLAHGSFVKEVTVDGKTTKYPSYLEFARFDGKWLILTEGDAVTDRNLTKHTGSSVGDYDGDGAKETARLVIPEVDWEAMDCVGDCNCKIVFSDPVIPEIPIESCVGGAPVNEGDLDDDGADEIGLLPWWFTSCWRGYQVFTIKRGKAEHLIPPPMTHCNQWDRNPEVVEKDPSRPGTLIVRETSMMDHSLIERSVKLRDVPRGVR